MFNFGEFLSISKKYGELLLKKAAIYVLKQDKLSVWNLTNE
jgi:hypothetical protein